MTQTNLIDAAYLHGTRVQLRQLLSLLFPLRPRHTTNPAASSESPLISEDGSSSGQIMARPCADATPVTVTKQAAKRMFLAIVVSIELCKSATNKIACTSHIRNKM